MEFIDCGRYKQAVDVNSPHSFTFKEWTQKERVKGAAHSISIAKHSWLYLKGRFTHSMQCPCRSSQGHSTRGCTVKADSHIACRVHAAPLPCHFIYTVRPCLIRTCYCVVLLLFVLFCCYGVVLLFVFCYLCCSVYCLCVNVYCTTATGCLPNCSWQIYQIHLPCRAHAMQWPRRPSQGHGTAWHGIASVNETRPRCVNQMGKTHSKPLGVRHGRGTACYVWIGLKRAVTWQWCSLASHIQAVGKSDTVPTTR